MFLYPLLARSFSCDGASSSSNRRQAAFQEATPQYGRISGPRETRHRRRHRKETEHGRQGGVRRPGVLDLGFGAGIGLAGRSRARLQAAEHELSQGVLAFVGGPAFEGVRRANARETRERRAAERRNPGNGFGEFTPRQWRHESRAIAAQASQGGGSVADHRQGGEYDSAGRDEHVDHAPLGGDEADAGESVTFDPGRRQARDGEYERRAPRPHVEVAGAPPQTPPAVVGLAAQRRERHTPRERQRAEPRRSRRPRVVQHGENEGAGRGFAGGDPRLGVSRGAVATADDIAAGAGQQLQAARDARHQQAHVRVEGYGLRVATRASPRQRGRGDRERRTRRSAEVGGDYEYAEAGVGLARLQRRAADAAEFDAAVETILSFGVA